MSEEINFACVYGETLKGRFPNASPLSTRAWARLILAVLIKPTSVRTVERLSPASDSAQRLRLTGVLALHASRLIPLPGKHELPSAEKALGLGATMSIGRAGFDQNHSAPRDRRVDRFVKVILGSCKHRSIVHTTRRLPQANLLPRAMRP